MNTEGHAQGMEAEGRDACGSGPQGRQPGAAERHAPNNRRTPESAPTGEALTDEQIFALIDEHDFDAPRPMFRFARAVESATVRAALATHPSAPVAPAVPPSVLKAAQAFVANDYRGPLHWAAEVFDWVAATPSAEAPRKSLSAAVADALRPFLAAGQKVIWREPFRWHDDNGVMSNHYDGMSLDSLAAEFGYEVIHDCGCAGVIKRPPSAEAQPTPKDAA